MRPLLIAAIAAQSFSPLAATTQDPLVSVAFDPPRLVLHEPVLVDFRVENNLTEAIHVDLGWNRTDAFALSIQQPDGTIVQAPPPRPPMGGLGLRGEMTVKDGSSFSQKLLLNKWSTFEQVGLYQVEIRMSAKIVTSRGAIVRRPTNSVVQVEIGERDDNTLDEICRRLADTAWSTPNAAEFLDAALLLSYVNDPIGVRYMRYVLAATERVDSLILEGLRRINSEEARAVLAEAAQTGNGERAAIASDILRQLNPRSDQPRQ